MYIIGDINARHTTLGHTNNNAFGNALNLLLRNNQIVHLGPDFKTVVTPRGVGNPDVILGNNKIHFNLLIDQGPITSSDHLPVIVKLATKPIAIQPVKKRNFKKANWQGFKDQVDINMENLKIDGTGGIDKQKLDQMVENWHNIVLDAVEENIPQKVITILPHPRLSEKQKQLQFKYNALKNMVSRYGWSNPIRILFRIIQDELIEEARKNYTDNWKNILQKVEIKYNEPRIFWSQIRMLQGGKQDTTPYIKNARGEKIYEDKEKEKEFRKVWQNIFKISDEENRNFCTTTERAVDEFLRKNSKRTKPYKYAILDRLNSDNFLIKPIENDQ